MTRTRVAACAVLFTMLALASATARAAPTLSEQWDTREEERLEGYYQHPEGQARTLLALKAKAKGEGNDPVYWMALGQLARIAGYVRALPAAPLAREAQAELPRARAAGDVLNEATLLIGLISARSVDMQLDSSFTLVRRAVELGEEHRMPGLVREAKAMEATLFQLQGRVVESVQGLQTLQYEAPTLVVRWEAELSRVVGEVWTSAMTSDLPRLIAKYEAALDRIDPDRAFFLVVLGQMHRTSLLARQKRLPEAFQVLEEWQQRARKRGSPPEDSEYFGRWAGQLYELSERWNDCLRVTPLAAPTEAVILQFNVLEVRLRCRVGLKDPSVADEVQRLEALLPRMEQSPLFQERTLSAIDRGYASLGNHEKAYAAAQKARDLMARRFAAANDVARREAEAKYDMAAKEKETALLKASAQLQTQRRDALAVGLVLTVVGLATLAMLLRRQARQKRELSALSASLRASNDELQALNASRARLLAAACHDLRQPAHALGMLAETAALQVGPQGQAPVQAMKQCSSALSDMLDMLLDMTQLQADRYRPLPRAFALQELLQGLQAQFVPLAQRKGLSLDVQQTDVVVLSDLHLVRRMLMNLVSNAIKYTHEGKVRIEALAQGQQVTICVNDTGPGIPPDQLEQVFGEYVRLDAGSAVEGLGIGLPIVKRAAELLGHPLTLTSQVGQGTRVSLTLPLAQGPAAADVDEPEVQGQGRRLGVVDDDANIREATAQLLRAHGFTVVTAESVQALAREAQAAWQAAPELLVTDLHLEGGHDGLQDIRTQRQAPGWADVAMVLVTGDLSPDVAGKAAALGVALAYKPVQPKRLLRLVQQILERRKSFHGTPARVPAEPS